MEKIFLVKGLIVISLLLILAGPHKARGYIGESGIYGDNDPAIVATSITQEENGLPGISLKIKSASEFNVCIYGYTTAPEGSSRRKANTFLISYKPGDGDYEVTYGSPLGVFEAIFPMGSIFKDGNWHTFSHNIDDLIFEITGYHLESVNFLTIQTHDLIRIDEIELFSGQETRMIDSFSYQSSPIGLRWYYSNTSTALATTVYDSSIDSWVLNLECTSPDLPLSSSSPAWEEFKSKYGGSSITWNEATNLPSSIFGFTTPPSTDPPEKIVRDFLADNYELLGIDPSTLVLDSITEPLPDKVKVLFAQVYQNVAVNNSYVFVFMEPTGEIYYFSSNWYIPDLSIDIIPSLTQEEAALVVKADLNTNKDIGSPELVIYQDVDGDMALYLAWKFSFSLMQEGSWVYHIDAHDGSIIRKFDTLMYAVIPTNNSSSSPEHVISADYLGYLGYYGQSPFYGWPLYPGHTLWDSPLSYNPSFLYTGFGYNSDYQYMGNSQCPYTLQYPSMWWESYCAPFNNFVYNLFKQLRGYYTITPWLVYYLGQDLPYFSLESLI